MFVVRRDHNRGVEKWKSKDVAYNLQAQGRQTVLPAWVRIDPLFDAKDPARALRRQRHVRAAALPNTDAVDSLRRDRILSPSKDARDLPITRSHHHRPMQPVYICEKLAKVVELASSQKRD